MQNSIEHLLQTSPLEGVALLLLGFVLFILLGIAPGVGVLYVVYYLVTLPLRRNERVRVMLDFIESGLRDGRSPESVIASLGTTRDPSLGQRLLYLSTLLQSGLRLSQGLEQVPRLAPPQIRAMLAAGERIGDIGKVLPACRLLLQDSLSQVRGALNYLLLLSFVSSPVMIAIPIILKLKVLPAFEAVFSGMTEGAKLPALTRFVFAENWVFIAIQISIFAAIWLLTLAYLGGPRLRETLDAALMGRTRWLEWLAFQLPWRRKRLQRDFSAMLAVLLEAGTPEPEAVRLAADSTANAMMRRRAARACELLGQGGGLPKALEAMEESGEFGWRLKNALRRGSGFTRALAGWHEALDARAFQLEQAAAQLFTTIVVLLSGSIVALILIAMFLPLIQIINQASLW